MISINSLLAINIELFIIDTRRHNGNLFATDYYNGKYLEQPDDFTQFNTEFGCHGTYSQIRLTASGPIMPDV